MISVVDSEGCTGDDTITVYYVDDPQSSFMYPPSACVDSSISFVDQSISNYPPDLPPISIVDWEWDFGDGTVQSGSQNTTHAYTTQGYYEVQLIVTNNLGCSDTVRSAVWANPPPNVDFEFENVCQDTLFTFTDLSTIDTGTVVGWSWDFGDGSTTEVTQNPVHQFNSEFNFDVTLEALSDSGCPASLTQQVYVFPSPEAGFSTTTVCHGNFSTFTDLTTVSAGVVEYWNWDFGDGSQSTLQNPVHTYADAGDFEVTLITITDSICRDTITQSITVQPAPVAGFVTDTVCAELLMQFTDTSSIGLGSIVSWSWYFGDGAVSSAQNTTHVYSEGGQYMGGLVVESDLGCVDTVSRIINIHSKPLADFDNVAACFGNSNEFTDQSSVAIGSQVTGWDWDFGDNAGFSTDQHPFYVYATSGDFDVTLIAETDQGCLDTVTYTSNVFDLPLSDFTFDDVCLADAAIFQSTSSIPSGSIVSYAWDFGDGDVSSNQQPLGQPYSVAGFYDVELITESNNGCSDTLIQTIEIFPTPTASFTFDSVCYPLTTSFADVSEAGGVYNILEWEWRFGDGVVDLGIQNPVHNYPNWGDYWIQLTVTTAAGCKADTLIGPAIVYPKPVADFSDAVANCFRDTTFFEDLSTIENDSSDIVNQWNWDFADGQSSIEQHPNHIYPVAGFYDTELAVTSNHGCQDTIIRAVEIYPLPDVKFTVDTNFGCQPFLAFFTDSTEIPQPYTLADWQWTFGDSTGNWFDQHPNHTYWDEQLGDFSVGVYSVSLQVTSSNGCVADTVYENYMTEYPKPDALFDVDPLRRNILFPKFKVTDQASPNVESWFYEWGDGETSTDQNPEHEYQDTGYYDIVQYVITQFGCMDTAEVRVIVDPEFRFYIPSAFTPDEDQVNDNFAGYGIGIKKYAMYIFDRWGELIFESNDYEIRWDGSYKGSQVQNGVYVYFFDILDVEDETHEYRGHVTLFR
ncbi:MAG: PKD domain-containing protein [Bacteroidetes bacterium]|nr:PKD domain-containing protein [Bacteroidota bacterium]